MIYRLGFYYFCLFLHFSIVAPYMSLYLRSRGFSLVHVGLSLGLFEVFGILGPLVFGRLADRTGWGKWLISGTLFACILAFTVLEYSSFFPLSVILIAFFGFMYRPAVPLSDAISQHHLPSADNSYGKVRAMGTLGFLIPSLFIQYSGLLDGAPPHRIYLFFVFFASVNMVAAFWLPKEEKHLYKERKNLSIRDFPPVFWIGLAAIFLARLGKASYYSFFALYLSDKLGMESVSGMFALAAFAEIPFVYFGGKLLGKRGIPSLFALAFGGIVVRLLIFAFIPNFSGAIAGQLLHAVTFGIFHITSISFIGKTVPPNQKNLGMTLYISLGFGLSGFIGSILGGYVLDRGGFSLLFSSFSLFPFIAVLLVPQIAKGLKKLETS